jgi:type IV pilus assembly protein PilE
MKQQRLLIVTKQQVRGFTLIELMIVIAVIGILAAIAYPSYRDSVQKSRRGQVKAEMVELQQILERCFTNQNHYDNCFSATGNNLAALPEYGASPPGALAAVRFYNKTVTSAGAAPILNFTITATPANDQADDRCGTLTINEQGVRIASTGVAGCW